ncbi:response regulator transcription factor [Poseidonibacter ostreae]|jgi:two-component system, OmpR family, response regulator VanR|uniref:Response regulator n=1 Tax=Poseidonibacter ostreae TaxID=2654171 RepID=A0A6L4WQR5_9BACT|nr:response regulator transcription factor [Poseidonibacter ostreae]KAB7887250.1 response regulator [Poseidonibacter ostreae]KAB7888307.1 response regulator [Poseidonibacter ostreae]KAB7889521.1 response regulator [Poseidonibacter ostreae]MAC82915.1 DNA-binding response regulator [Arcobacter sp.]|tara:strand:- start:1780 stop:2460 length:681 start_codon:yes stop_codon:yes gene_type:complete
MDEKILEQFRNYRILCVEDEDGIRKRVVSTLKYYFDDVLEASNGEDGYDLYEEYKPDIIISDIQMPKKNGIEMVQNIRKKDLSTIIIMLTAYSSEEYLLQLINLNINHYILKPITSDSLLNGIIKSFANKFDEKIQFDNDVYFNVKEYELYYKDEIISLRKREKEFLLLLCKNKNSIVTYEQIEEYLWRDKSMSMSALKTFIKELRQRLPINLIVNIPQLGYKIKS